MAKGWKQTFDDPIPLPGGRQLVTLQAAGNYIVKLPKAEHMAPQWQLATEALILAAGDCWPCSVTERMLRLSILDVKVARQGGRDAEGPAAD
jgi:hypothetical protein